MIINPDFFVKIFDIYDEIEDYSAANLLKGATYLNGKQVDGLTTDFPIKHLGLVTLVATGQVCVNQISWHRNYIERTWQGDIIGILIYNEMLSDENRLSVEN